MAEVSVKFVNVGAYPFAGKPWHVVKDVELYAATGSPRTYVTLCGKRLEAIGILTRQEPHQAHPLCKACDRSRSADALIEGG
jgi:hypothetical protein